MALVFDGRTYPALTVEIAFVADPYGTLTWTDVTGHWRGCDTQRGRNYELGKTEAGTLSMALENLQGQFDPTNASSPYYPYVLPYRPIRVRATWLTVTYDLWRGYVERWPQKWAVNGDYGTVDITAVDGFKTVLAKEFGPRYVDLESASTTGAIAHFDIASGTESNTGTSGGTFGQVSVGTNAQPTYHLSPALLGTSGYSMRLSPSTVALQGPGGSFVASFSGWVKPTAIKTDSTLGVFISSASTTAGTVADRLGVQYGATAAAARFTARIASGGTFVTLTSTTVPVAGIWYHVALVADTTGGTGTLYINGYSEATTAALTLPSASGTAVFIGSQSTVYPGSLDPAFSFDGNYDEFEYLHATPLSARDVLNRYLAGSTYREFSSQLSGARCAAVLDTVSWPSALRTIAAGSSTLQATGSLNGASAVATLQAVADAELGDVFINGAGYFVFQGRTARNSATSVATFGDGVGEIPYEGDIVIEFDDTYIYNDIQVTQQGSSPTYLAESVDTSSQTTYGLRVLARTEPLATLADVTGQAATLLARYKDPHARVPQISLEGRGNTGNFVQMLSREIGELVTVNRRPTGATAISIGCFIDGIKHHITPNAWTATFMLTPQYPNATY